MTLKLVCRGYGVEIPLKHQTKQKFKTMTNALESGLIRPIAFTERETQILNLIAKGKTTREIADELWLSVNTVESHRKRMIRRVNAKNIFGVFNYTITNGIINPLVFSEPCFV